MDDIAGMVGSVVSVFVVVPLAVAMQGHLLASSVLSNRFKLTRLTEKKARDVFKVARKRHAEVAQWGFDHLGCYRFNTVPPGQASVWRRPDRPVFICAYVIANTRTIDIVSVFEGGIGLTTGNARSGDLYPLPAESYMQIFPKEGLADLWRRHCESEAYLMRTGGVAKGDPELTFEEAFTEGIRRQFRYVKTIRFWSFRALWWYVGMLRGRRGHLRRTIAEQHQDQFVKLPNDLGFEAFEPPMFHADASVSAVMEG